MTEREVFKTCTNCRKVWEDRNAFLADPDVRVEGYQVNFGHLEAGFFLFTHRSAECGSTIAIPAGVFTDMNEGEIFEENIFGQDGCDKSCLHPGVVDACRAKCECAYVRDVLAQVRNWKKN